MADPNRWRSYQKRLTDGHEHWYLDIGPTKEQWRRMSARQQAVHKRWVNYYRRRRALREMCRGEA